MCNVWVCSSLQKAHTGQLNPIELYRTTILRLGNWLKDTSNTFKCQLSGLWNVFPIFLLFLFLRIPFIWILTSRSILKLAWRPLKTSAEATGWLADWLGFWLQTQLSLPSPQLSRGKRNWYTQRIKKCRMIDIGQNGFVWKWKIFRTVLRSQGSHWSRKSMCFLLNSLRTLPLRRCVLHCLLSKHCWIPFEDEISLLELSKQWSLKSKRGTHP